MNWFERSIPSSLSTWRRTHHHHRYLPRWVRFLLPQWMKMEDGDSRPSSPLGVSVLIRGTGSRVVGTRDGDDEMSESANKSEQAKR
jgi:hypothetical protein